MNFCCIDVETANPNLDSICQIGVVRYENDELVDEWMSLINPETYFEDINVRIHGISANDVRDSPRFRDVVETLRTYLDKRIVVSHTGFDRRSINSAMLKLGQIEFDSEWLDSAFVVRRTWEEFSERGYGLRSICDHLNYDFQHHDALEDAKAAAFVLLKAFEESGKDLHEWLTFKTQPLH